MAGLGEHRGRRECIPASLGADSYGDEGMTASIQTERSTDTFRPESKM